MQVIGYFCLLLAAAIFAPWTGIGRLLGLW